MHKHGGEIYARHYRLDYSVNVNLLGCPPAVIEAAKKGAELADRYPDVECRALRGPLAGKLGVRENQIVFGNGAADVIITTVLARKPRKVLLPAPTFAEYEQAARMVSAEPVYYYLKEEDNFDLTEDILDLLTPDIDMLFICNPNNPTGRVVSRNLLEKILDRCLEADILVVVDECFNEFLDQPESVTLVPQLERRPNLLILKAFTKVYAMPGLRLGYGLCSNRDYLDRMADCNQPWAVSIPAQYAGAAALSQQEFVDRSMAILRKERAYLQKELKRLGFKLYDSRANYIFLKTDLPLKEACGAKGILIRDCSNYVGLGPGYYRIAVRQHEDNVVLIQALEEIIHG